MKPKAYMYEMDGMVHNADFPEVVCSIYGEVEVGEPWTKTPLYEIPDGYRLVPIVPTRGMRDSGRIAQSNGVTVAEIWEAMVIAAPEPKNE